MTHVRSKAAVVMVAVLLASCTGVVEQTASRPAEAPPQAVQEVPVQPQSVGAEGAVAVVDTRAPDALQTPSAPDSADKTIVVTGTRVARQNFESHSPIVTIDSTTLASSAVVAPSPPTAAMRSSPVLDQRIVPQGYIVAGRDKFTSVDQNPFRVVSAEPVSTFSIDVDTASYSFVRASLNRNVLPQPDAVRTEEMINYFPYDYEAPRSAARPFSTSVDVFPSPWTEGRKLVRIGIRGYDIDSDTRPRANLVFLIDTSGSMSGPGRLDLVKQSLAMLIERLGPNDRVSIVTYAGNAGTALEPTPANDRRRILSVIENLGAGGSTAGAEGIRQAYALAQRNFDPEGVNRVILATDGDFNVGITNQEELKGYIERERGKGVFLSVLGFGMGNYNDALMQTLAQNGNGTAAYIDSLSEARKTLVEEAGSTLFTIAKDVKIQIEFNPATVAEYRLVGYETRMLAREDFDNDNVDAGDVGAGRTVTAIYEIVPIGGPRAIGDLRYSRPLVRSEADNSTEYGFVKIRYKQPNSDRSQLITTAIDRAAEVPTFAEAPRDARFATGVATFAELLRGGRYSGSMTYDDVLQMVSTARGEDEFGYRSEFVQLVRAAKTAATMARLGQ